MGMSELADLQRSLEIKAKDESVDNKMRLLAALELASMGHPGHYSGQFIRIAQDIVRKMP